MDNLNDIIQKYRSLIWGWIYNGGKGIKDTRKRTPQEQEDLHADVLTDFITVMKKGEFRGEHEDASIIALLKEIYIGRRAELFRHNYHDKDCGRMYDPTRPDIRTVGGEDKIILGKKVWCPEERLRTDSSSSEDSASMRPVTLDTLPSSEDSQETDTWIENFDTPYMCPEQTEKYERQSLGVNPVVRHEQEYKSTILDGTKQGWIMALFRQEYTVEEIAETLNMTEDSIWAKLKREKKRLSDTVDPREKEPDYRKEHPDKSLELMLSQPSKCLDNTEELLSQKDFQELSRYSGLGYTKPPDETKVKPQKGIYKGHVALHNKIVGIQNKWAEVWTVCVKCGKVVGRKKAITDNGLTYCRACYSKTNIIIKKFKKTTRGKPPDKNNVK